MYRYRCVYIYRHRMRSASHVMIYFNRSSWRQDKLHDSTIPSALRFKNHPNVVATTPVLQPAPAQQCSLQVAQMIPQSAEATGSQPPAPLETAKTKPGAERCKLPAVFAVCLIHGSACNFCVL